MSDPWASVLPSAVTSVVTTLITLAATFGVGRVKRTNSLNRQPLLIRQTSPTAWGVLNRTKRLMLEFNANVQSDNDYRALDTGRTVYAYGDGYLGEIRPGELVTINWVEMKRNRPKSSHHVSFRMKADVDEYLPEVREPYGNGGGR